MNKKECKIGDRVERVRGGQNSNMNIGTRGIIIKIYDKEQSVDVKTDDEKVSNHDPINLDLISRREDTNKKIKPIVKHIVLQDSCSNVVAQTDNYEDAIRQQPSRGETFTVYRLVPVAKLENTTKVTKIK